MLSQPMWYVAGYVGVEPTHTPRRGIAGGTPKGARLGAKF